MALTSNTHLSTDAVYKHNHVNFAREAFRLSKGSTATSSSVHEPRIALQLVELLVLVLAH